MRSESTSFPVSHILFLPPIHLSFTKEIKKKKKGKKARREGGRKERSREGKDEKKRQERLAAMKAAGCVQAPGLWSLGSWSGTLSLSSSRALSYCDVFCLLWLHMSPSRAMVPTSRNSALSPPSSPQHHHLLNCSILSSDCVHPQEESCPVQLAQNLWCLMIFPTKKRKKERK